MAENYIDTIGVPDGQGGTTEKLISPSAENVRYSGSVPNVTNVKAALDALAASAGSDEVDTIISSKGTVGANYSAQMKKVVELDENKSCLHFIHVSDTHGTDIGTRSGSNKSANALGSNGLLKHSEASFYVHTGDLVAGNFWNAYTFPSHFYNETKPCFITLGNHDCSQSTKESSDGATGARTAAAALQARYNKYFLYPNDAATYGNKANTPFIDAAEVQNGKTYYHADFVKGTNTFRGIFLDFADAHPQDKDTNDTIWGTGYMSTEQKAWFLTQLQEAASGGYHVAIFCHYRIDEGGQKIPDWYSTHAWDAANYSAPSGLRKFLGDAVNAFIEGTTYSLDGAEYSFTKNGIFIGWFAGHTHYDVYGWSRTYNKQFLNVVNRFESKSSETGGNASTYYDDCVATGNPHFRYVTIDFSQRKVTILNIGEEALQPQNGRERKRKIFSYNY